MMLFEPTPPEEFLVVASCYDQNGETGIRLSRVLAHNPDEALHLLEVEIYNDYGLSWAEVEKLFAAEDEYDAPPVTIDYVEVFPIRQLSTLPGLASPFVEAYLRAVEPRQPDAGTSQPFGGV